MVFILCFLFFSFWKELVLAVDSCVPADNVSGCVLEGTSPAICDVMATARKYQQVTTPTPGYPTPACPTDRPLMYGYDYCKCGYSENVYDCSGVQKKIGQVSSGYKGWYFDQSGTLSCYDVPPTSTSTLSTDEECDAWCRAFSTPTPTSTPTTVPTSTPTTVPTPTPACDFAGCGLCGVRRSDSTCYTDWGNAVYRLDCCHQDCVASSCEYINGGGAWNCDACWVGPPPTNTPTSTPTSTPTPTPGSRNQICDADFLRDRRVVFEVTAADGGGGSGINQMSLRLNDSGTVGVLAVGSSLNGTLQSSITGVGASFYGAVTTTVAGNSRTIRFPIYFAEDFREGLYNIEVSLADSSGESSGWTDTTRDFRVWNCRVGVGGTMFDASDSPLGPVCPGGGYGATAGSEMTFGQLTYVGISPAADQAMSINSPFYTNGASWLQWGETYRADLAGLNGGVPVMRIDGGTCPGGLQITLNESLVDPYATSPTMRIDFSSLRNQSPWFQVKGGPVMARIRVRNDIPLTCATDSNCLPATMLASGVGRSDEGLVAAPAIDNESGCGDSCRVGELKSWSWAGNILAKTRNYKYFYDEYAVKQTIGKVYGTGVSMSTVVSETGGTGVVLVNGNLGIDVNNAVSVGQFLMIVASGQINIGIGVSKVEGVLVADGNITTLGSGNQLEINGMVYSAGGSVSLGRNLSGSSNNTNPGTVVSYRPDLIFSMPAAALGRTRTWRER